MQTNVDLFRMIAAPVLDLLTVQPRRISQVYNNIAYQNPQFYAATATAVYQTSVLFPGFVIGALSCITIAPLYVLGLAGKLAGPAGVALTALQAAHWIGSAADMHEAEQPIFPRTQALLAEYRGERQADALLKKSVGRLAMD